MNKNTKRYAGIISEIIYRYLPDAQVIVYGSRARGEDREGSDIDIAINIGKKIDELVMAKIFFDIEESSLPIPFDMVDLHNISEHMKKEIGSEGVVWQK